MTIFNYFVESTEQFFKDRNLERNQIRSLLENRSQEKFFLSQGRRNEYQSHLWKYLEKYSEECVVITEESLYLLFIEEVDHDIGGLFLSDKKEYSQLFWEAKDVVFVFVRESKDDWFVRSFSVIALY